MQTAPGWKQNVEIHQYECGSMKNFVYLISCLETLKVWIVDPQKDWERCEKDWEKNGFSLAGCLLTHSHHDHIAGLPTLLQKFPDLPIIVGEGDAFRLQKLKSTFKNLQLTLLKEDTEFFLGSLKCQALYSPGHSAGEFCFYFPEITPPTLLTGDVLFIRECGRTDLETGSDLELFQTLQRLKALPLNTRILPGHHYAPECESTLEKELETSLPLKCKTWEELRDLP